MSVQQQPAPDRVRPPGPSYIWSAAWFVIALVGFVLLGFSLAGVGTHAFAGRSSAVLIGVPIIALILGIIILVSALRRRPAWRELVSRTTALERRDAADVDLADENWGPPLTLGVVVAIVWLAGAVVLAIFSGDMKSSALVAGILGLCLLGLMWAGLVSLGLRRRAARSRVAAARS